MQININKIENGWTVRYYQEYDREMTVFCSTIDQVDNEVNKIMKIYREWWG